MCEASTLTNIISLVYLIICFGIPIGYIYLFYNYKAKHKNYIKAFTIALVMFALLYSVKLIVRIDIKTFQCANCYINNKCKEKGDKTTMPTGKEIKTSATNKNTQSETKTSSTITPSKTTNTSTSKNIQNEKKYKRVATPSGNRVDVGKTNKGYTIYEIDGVPYIDGYLIANKTYILPSSYVPTNTYTKADGNSTKQCASCIEKTAYQAWQDMKADAKAVGLNIYISSGFRSYITQNNIYNRNVEKNGKEKADTYSARPGSSEHQTGLCFDLNTIDSSFANTNEGKWVAQNAHKYGYIIRYPKGKTDETGYIYEPWHLRYVGSEMAEKLYNNGDWLTLENYFGITSKYAQD